MEIRNHGRIRVYYHGRYFYTDLEVINSYWGRFIAYIIIDAINEKVDVGIHSYKMK